MADDSRRISGSVSVEPTTKEYVALKLAERINSEEGREQFPKTRKYWLTLYSQCLKATSGYDLKSVLEEK